MIAFLLIFGLWLHHTWHFKDKLMLCTDKFSSLNFCSQPNICISYAEISQLFVLQLKTIEITLHSILWDAKLFYTGLNCFKFAKSTEIKYTNHNKSKNKLGASKRIIDTYRNIKGYLQHSVAFSYFFKTWIYGSLMAMS